MSSCLQGAGRLARWLIPVIVVSAGLAACGKSSSNTTSTAASSAGAVGGATANAAKLPTGTAKLCGDKPIKLAQVDGFGGNSWRKTVTAELKSELKPCSNVKISYAQAGGDIQKYNTAINSFAAQGYDIILTYDDFGAQGLPAIRKASKSGAVVVPYISDPGGTPGQDYTAFVRYDHNEVGKMWASWLNRTLNGNGNVIFMGGVPGNPSSLSFLKPTMANTASGIHWLQKKPVDTNWDPAQYQRVTAGLIAKYPKIDGIASDYGAGSVGEIRGYISAGRPHPPLATLASDNELGCLYQQQKKSWPKFQLLEVEGTTRVVRWAARRALAEFNHIKLSDPTNLKMFAFVDTTAGKAPKCRKDLPPDADLSSGLTPAELTAVFH
jgi:ribose transport system substrate-binding protein